MNTIAKYELELSGKNDKYTTCRIGDIQKIYCDEESNMIFHGACALLKNPDYPGYCTLTIVHHSKRDDEFKNGYLIQFAPLYNEYGQVILIKYDHDDNYCSISSDVDSKKVFITFFNNGVVNYFTDKL